MTGAKCAGCGRQRPLDAMTPFWPRADPSSVRYVCRPSNVESGVYCFHRAVGAATRVGIGPGHNEGRLAPA